MNEDLMCLRMIIKVKGYLEDVRLTCNDISPGRILTASFVLARRVIRITVVVDKQLRRLR